VRPVRPAAPTAARRWLPSLRRPGDFFRDPRRPDRERRWRVRWPAVIAVLVLLLGLAWALVWSPLVGVREVAVAGVSGEDRERIIQIGAVAKGLPLVKVDTDRIADDVISLGTVSRVDVERHWPATIVIRVKPRAAAFAMGNAQGGVQVVDAEGLPFWMTDRPPPGVPLASLEDSEDPAQRVAAATVVRALSAAQRARVRDLRVAAPDRITVNIGDVVVTWGSAERSDVKAKIVEVLARRQGVTTINVVVPESPVTGGRAGSATKP
jgi:cell division protein FtsQ